MATLEHRDFSSPDETRTPDKTKVELLNIAGGQVGRYTFQPGWRWSECIKPVVNTDTCQVEHVGYCISGRIHVSYGDGTEGDIGAGDFASISPATTPGWSVTSRLSASTSAATPSTRRGSSDVGRVLDPFERCLEADHSNG